MGLTQNTRQSTQRSALSPEQIAGRRAHWLFELTSHEDDGNPRTYWYAVDEVSATTADGDERVYREGLGDLSVTVGDGLPSLSIELSGVPDGGSWAKQVARGLDLQACTGRLLRWFEGSDYEAAIVVASGRVTAPSYGDDAAPLRFSLASTVDDTLATVPPESAAVGPTTWPRTTSPAICYPPEQGNGAYYPWVFGTPGLRGGPYINVISTRIDVHASPAVVLEHGGSSALARTYGKLCVAGHEVAASTVFVRDVSAGYIERPYSRIQESVTVRTMQDGLGRTVSYVLQSDFTRLRIMDGNQYAVSWTGGGGIESSPGKPIRGAGEVIGYLLNACGIPVNKGRMAAARQRLDRFGLDFSLNTPTRARDFIEREIGSLIPLILRWSAEGVWYECVPYDATEHDVVAHLVADDSTSGSGYIVSREGDVVWSDVGSVANELSIRYGRESGGDTHKRRSCTWRQPADVAADEQPSLHCALSRSRYGARPRTVETDIVYADDTATALLNLWAMWWALPRRSLAYTGGTELDTLEPGSVVTVTDSDLYITSALAWVRAVTMSRSGTTVEVELLEQPNVRKLEGA
jgi:hypothetical protein